MSPLLIPHAPDSVTVDIALLPEGEPTPRGPVPKVKASLSWDETALTVHYDVRGEYGLQALGTKQNDRVHKDSAVECFLMPAGSPSYFNLEMSCRGVAWTARVTNPTREPGTGFVLGTEMLTREETFDQGLSVDASLASMAPTRTPCATPQDWQLTARIPWAMVANVLRAPQAATPHAGDEWRLGLYKCADKSPVPIWLTWAPLSRFDFHTPAEFGVALLS